MNFKLSNLQQDLLEKANNKHEMYQEIESNGFDDVYDRVKALVSTEDIKKVPKFSLTQEEKLAIYDSVIELVNSEESPDFIANAVVSVIQDKLDDLKAEATNEKGPQGPLFRRSE